MDESKVKRRRTSTKHSQTGCKTCKGRHIKCDEARPRCQNCEKGGRECVYVPKSPRPMAQPIPSEPSTSSLPYFDPNFSFRGPTAQTTALPLQPPTSTSRYPYDDIYSATQSLDPSDQYASRRNSTSASNSMAPSPQTRQPAPSTSTPMVRNAVLVNNIQSQMALRRAIHGFSRDFRLRGQPFTVETILSPLIYRSSALKHAIFANFILQAEQAKQHPPTSPLGTAAQDLSSAHVRHYHSAITHLRPNLGVPAMSDSNIATSLILAFYSICAGDMNNWAAHIRSTSDQIRLRGSNIDTHPLGLHTKFLFSMYMRTDTVGSNAVGQPANTDREIARIVYSGVPISGKILLPYRIELELLLAESSRFQYECNAYLSSVGAPWNDAHQETILREKYEDLLDRLGRWDGMNSELVSVEEAQPGEYIQGAMLPTEMGLPLLCNDQEAAQMWCLHCTAIINLHLVAHRHHLITQLPDQAREFSVLCCRIISGISIIDPGEPSVTMMWPLLTLSHVIDFVSGKLWVAQQLDSIADRYLSRNARLVAQQVRETVQSAHPTLLLSKAENATTKLTIPPNLQSWNTTPTEETYQSYMADDKTVARRSNIEDYFGEAASGWQD